jgi:hypothetical protein
MVPWKVRPVLLAALPLLLAAVSTFCQNASHPAGVLLVARLESVSVRAGVFSLSPEGFENDSGHLTLTSSWAVPAHWTTLRLSVRFAGASGALHLSRESETGERISAATNPVPGSTHIVIPQDRTSVVFVQSVGSTNGPVRRSYNLDLHGLSSLGKSLSAAGTPRPLLVILQAL